MTPEQRSQLRQRIIAEMPDILEQIAGEGRPVGLYRDDDFRPAVVRRIVEIAELEAMPRHAARRAFDLVDQHVRRLRLSIGRLPATARSLVEFEIRGLEDARTSVEMETGRTEARRKRLAAEAAFDLLTDHGSKAPTLFGEGPYVRLADLLFLVATGKSGDTRKSCARHFDDLKKADDVDFRSKRRGPRGKRGTGNIPAWLTAETASGHLEAEAARERWRRRAAIAKWPPLEQVVDEVLARPG